MTRIKRTNLKWDLDKACSKEEELRCDLDTLFYMIPVCMYESVDSNSTAAFHIPWHNIFIETIKTINAISWYEFQYRNCHVLEKMLCLTITQVICVILSVYAVNYHNITKYDSIFLRSHK